MKPDPTRQCANGLDEAHAALYRHVLDPKAPSRRVREWLKDVLFRCHYGVISCGWEPTEEQRKEREGYEALRADAESEQIQRFISLGGGDV